MLCTIAIGSCVSVQGEFVGMLANGEIVIRDGAKVYRGHPVQPTARRALSRDVIDAVEVKGTRRLRP